METRTIFLFILLLTNSFLFPAKRVIKRGLDTDSRSDDIIILHTNDVHCGVQDTIGYDGLMLLKKQYQKKYKNVLTVDVGDHIQGGIMGLLTNGTAIINIMNEIGYDVAALGNHEFDYGVEQLETCEKLLNCSYISTNYCFKKNKTSIYPAYKIIEVGDKKIGFVGVITPKTLTMSYLLTVTDDSGDLLYDFLTENNNKELYQRVQENIDKLRNEEKVDYVIILSHLGIEEDSEDNDENASSSLMKNVNGVDAVLDGHTHLKYSETTPDKDGKEVILAQTGTKLKSVGVLTIHTNGTLSHENIDEVPYDEDLKDEILNVTRSKTEKYVDKNMYEYINFISESYADLLDRVIGYSDFPLNIYLKKEDAVHSDNQLSRNQENVLCNLVGDAFKYSGESDVAFINAGSVRSDLDAGNITYQNILNIMPYSNDVISKEVTGQILLDSLEYGLRYYPEKTSRFPQVAGVKYKVDKSINSSVIVDENKSFMSVGGERRVYDVYVNGEKLDLNKKYTVAASLFILNGGDGYTMFTDCETVKMSFGVDNEILSKYIENYLGGKIPDKYNSTEGRIVFTDGKIYDTETNSSTIIEIDTNTKETKSILLGLGKYNKINNKGNLVAYFKKPMDPEIKSKKYLFFDLIIKYASRLRYLDEEKQTAIGELSSENNNILKYNISFNITSNKTINNIESLGNYAWSNNLNKTSSIPLIVSTAQGVDESNLQNNKEEVNPDKYIFFNNKKYELNGKQFSFLGNFSEEVNVNKDTLDFIYKQDDKEKNIACSIKQSGSDYKITCEPKTSIDTSFNGAYSYIKGIITRANDDTSNKRRNLKTEPEILEFDDNNMDNNIQIDYSRTPNFKKNSRGLSKGAIAGIVIACAVALLAIVAIAILARRKVSTPAVVTIPTQSFN